MQLYDTFGKSDNVGIDPKALLVMNSSKWSQSFIYPQFSAVNYVRTAQLADLCTLDVNMSSFPYSLIAAAAISHVIGQNAASRVSGFHWAEIAPCAKWMEPYFQVLDEDSELNPIHLLEANEQLEATYSVTHVCPNLTRDPSHILQTHSTSLEIFVSIFVRLIWGVDNNWTLFQDKAVLRFEHLDAAEAIIAQEASPAQTTIQPCPPGILTPPASNRKTLDLVMPNWSSLSIYISSYLFAFL